MRVLELRPDDGPPEDRYALDLMAALVGHSGVEGITRSADGGLILRYDPDLCGEKTLRSVVEGSGYGSWLPSYRTR